MLRYWSLKDTGKLYEKKYVCTTDPGQNRWPKVKNQVKLERVGNIKIWFFVTLDRYCPKFITGGETSDILVAFPDFLNS